MACDPIRQKLKTNLTRYYQNLFLDGSGDYAFLGVSKTTPWTNENLPPDALDSVFDETEFWRNMISLKRIKSTNISYVIPRYNWVSGQTYQSYSNTLDLFDDNSPSKFYVLVDNERVYKCIDNNGGISSTDKPQETSINIFQTADGYKWKYMYKIIPTKQQFLTNDFMPVYRVSQITGSNDPLKSQKDVQDAAVDGKIEFISLDTIGSSFQYALPDDVNNIFLATVATKQYQISSDNLSRVDGSYVNYSIKVTDPESTNYGEVRKITAYSGSNRRITLETDFTYPNDIIGHQYSIIPTVGISGDGTLATAEAKIDSDDLTITSIEMINGGSSYTYATVTIYPDLVSGSTLGSSTVLQPIATAILSPKNGHGYDAVKELGAAAIMISIDLNQDENDIIETKNDFRQFGIVLNPTINGYIAGSNDNVIQTYFVTSNTPINEFDGLTRGEKIVLGNSSGYSGQFKQYIATIGQPKNGNLELLNTNGNLQQNDTLIKLDTDYTDGLVTDVKIDRLISEEIENEKVVYRQTLLLNITKVTNDFTDTTFEEDTVIKGKTSGATGIVSSWVRNFSSGSYSTTNGVLEVIYTDGTFVAGENLVTISGTSESSVKANITSISQPEMDYRSGELIYLENIQVVERDDNQREEFKIVFKI